MPQTNSPITTVLAGPEALAELVNAVEQAQAEDPFARVVIIADHHDAARSVRHLLGSRGLINVTVQTGRQLAGELAKPDRKLLPHLFEFHAVRQAARDEARDLGLASSGEQRFYRSLIAAFQEMQERSEAHDDDDLDEMSRHAEVLHGKFLGQIHARGYYTTVELPQMAADALVALPEGKEPAVIYYLPRRMSDGDVRLAQALLKRGKCRLIAGCTGDTPADKPVAELLRRLGHQPVETQTASGDDNPLLQRAKGRTLSIVAAPDPEEEVRGVIRSIAAGTVPFHRVAVVHRQDNPYASLLRQELGFAGIPFSGMDYRSLADTPTGLLLLGLVDLAVSINAQPGHQIERERLIEWLTAASVRLVAPGVSGDGKRSVPASSWAKLARDARANGGVVNWCGRLDAYFDHMEQREKDRGNSDGEGNEFLQGLRQSIDAFQTFLKELAVNLNGFAAPRKPRWKSVSDHLKTMLYAYRWLEETETEEDRRRIGELIENLAGLDQWEIEYSPELLHETVREGLQSPVSERGKPIGTGVYLGPPSGMAGADYDTVYGVGMVERQFPPRPRANPWLLPGTAELQQDAALERYDFLCAIASARSAVLSWPSATAERSVAYPSRWLIEAANHLHHSNGGQGRLTHENLTSNSGKKVWLTLVESREAGLRKLVLASDRPADELDYNLMHLVSESQETLRQHQAIASDARMIASLDARAARESNKFSEWDGNIGAVSLRIRGIASQESPISPSALEAWATCPYRFFLSGILRLSALPDEEDVVAISALERGSLVHKILERFVTEENDGSVDTLTKLANEEFTNAECRGVTGHHLLWQITKAQILAALQTFMPLEQGWLQGELGSPADPEVCAEVSFGPPTRQDGKPDQPTELGEVHVHVDGLDEPVWFRGRIDRVDLSGDMVVVRDFKTSDPDRYTKDNKEAYTVKNGRALQLPVYVVALQAEHRDADFLATYCFPLEKSPEFDGRPYRVGEGYVHHFEEFHITLGRIIRTARAGVFPATPDGDSQHSNCGYCDFKRVCPVRRRQIWERKANGEPETVRCFNALGGKAAVVQE